MGQLSAHANKSFWVHGWGSIVSRCCDSKAPWLQCAHFPGEVRAKENHKGSLQLDFGRGPRQPKTPPHAEQVKHTFSEPCGLAQQLLGWVRRVLEASVSPNLKSWLFFFLSLNIVVELRSLGRTSPTWNTCSSLVAKPEMHFLGVFESVVSLC
jgi:hypothetical protein